MTALQSAQAGDTILLAAGSYSNITIQNFNCAGTVTIASADPSNRALLSDLSVLSSSGLAFTGLELSSDASKFPGLSTTIATDGYPFRVTSSDRVSFDKVSFHGSLDNDPSNDRSGLLINTSTHVSVTNSEFQQTAFGIVHSLSDYVTFSDNYFHDVRSDGIHGSSSHAVVTDNYFTSFHVATGDHPDAIQFFDEGLGHTPHDISISGNVYVRGTGDAIEGIFLRVLDDWPEKFNNVTITDNLMIGTTYHGITVLGASNLSITSNATYGFSDYSSRIWIGNSATVSELNNKSSAFIYGSTTNITFDPNTSNTGITVTGNSQTSTVTDGGKSLFDAWVASHPSFTAYLLGSTTTTPPPPPPPTTTPPPPSGLVLDDSSDTGVKGDGWTKTQVVRIDGVAEAGASVTLYEGNVQVASGVADSSGAFSVLSSLSLGDGAHALTAVAKSASGLTSAASQALNVVIDTVAGATDLIDFAVSKYNKSASNVTLTGTANDNSGCVVSVDVFRDGALVQSVAANAGAWSFGEVVGNGVHTYTMQGTDAAGNVAAAAHSLVIGSANAETVRGTTGADFICAGAGYDTLTGGGGNDVFVFGVGDAAVATTSRNGRLVSVETITDFSTGDKIDLTDLGHLTFGTQTSAVVAYKVDWYVSGGNTFVVADVNGDGKADFMVELLGVHTMTAADFLLA